MKWRVTYEIVTPESAAEGDAEERGFLLPGAWKVAADSSEDVNMSLREALALCSPQEDCGRWLSEVDGDTDYRTGAVTTRSLHPPRYITPASYGRLCRLLGVQRNG